jgi:hypothetical protein
MIREKVNRKVSGRLPFGNVVKSAGTGKTTVPGKDEGNILK